MLVSSKLQIGDAVDEMRYAVAAISPVVAAIVLRHVATHIECGNACLGTSQWGVWCRYSAATRCEPHGTAYQ